MAAFRRPISLLPALFLAVLAFVSQQRSNTVLSDNIRSLVSNMETPVVGIAIGGSNNNQSATPLLIAEEVFASTANLSNSLPRSETAVRITNDTRSGNVLPLLKETNVSFLWSADASPNVRLQNLRQLGNITISLVISHCDKPLDWIIEYFAHPIKPRLLRKFTMLNYTIHVDRIHIFTKCGGNKTQMDSFQGAAQQSSMAPREITITNLPNVGRCDHTYAYWLEQYTREQQQQQQQYTSMTHEDNDIVFFMKDNNHRTQLRQSLTHLKLHHLAGNAVTMGFSCFEQEKMSVLRKSQVRPRTAVYHKSNYHSLDELRFFYMEEYRREEHRDMQDAFHSSNYSTMGLWLDALDYKLYGSVKWKNTTLIPLCIGGMFAVTKGQIRKNQNDWSRLVQSLSRGNNIVEGHYCERTWAALLSDPLEQSQVDDIGSLIVHEMTVKGNPWHPIPGRMYAGEVKHPKAYRKDQSGLILPCCNRTNSSLEVAPVFD